MLMQVLKRVLGSKTSTGGAPEALEVENSKTLPVNIHFKTTNPGDSEVSASDPLPTVAKAGTAVIGKVRLVTATGDEVTDDTSDTVKVSGSADVVVAAPTPYNVTLTVADTEYSQVLPANCRRFEFQCRTSYDVRFAFATGKVATSTAPYLTLKAARWYDSGAINQGASPSTLYLASATAGVVVEILAWT